MSHSHPLLVVLLGAGAYVGVLTVIVLLAVRWSRRVLKHKSDAFAGGLGSDARLVGETALQARYHGFEREYDVDGQRVFVRSRYVGRDFVRTDLRVTARPCPAVVLYPEHALQRFGKAIRLNREVQLGDGAFDDAVYIDTAETDDDKVKRLLSAEAVRAGVRELLALGYKVQFSMNGISAFRVAYALKAADGSGSRAAVAVLKTLAEHVPSFDAATLAPASKGRSVLLGAAVVVPAFAGVMAAAAADASGGHLLDPSGVGEAFLIGLGCWLVYLAVLVLAVRGTSRALTVVLVAGGIGLFGVPILGAVTPLMLNEALDHSPAVSHWAAVRRLDRHRHHEIRVASWRTPGREETVRVPTAVYRGLKLGDEVNVRVHPGRFGWAWAEPVTEHRPAGGG